jgi:hypothetical protein
MEQVGVLHLWKHGKRRLYPNRDVRGSDFRVLNRYSSHMGIKKILAELDVEIARLKQAKGLLTGETVKRGPGRPKATPAPTVTSTKKKRKMSPEGRARIVAAVKARWAKQKKAAK